MNELKNVIFIYHGYYSATKKGGNSAIYNMDEPSEVAQSCPTLCNPMDCSLTGSSIHGIFQARILEWFAISFSRMNLEAIVLSQINRSQKVNATWFRFHVESKVVKVTEAESRRVIVRGWEEGEMGVLQRVQSFRYRKWIGLEIQCTAWWE